MEEKPIKCKLCKTRYARQQDWKTEREKEICFTCYIKEAFIQKLELSPRDEKIIKFRAGFDDDIPHTLEETGKLFDITRERVRQIEARVLEKISLNKITNETDSSTKSNS